MYNIKIKDNIIWSVAYGDTSILYKQYLNQEAVEYFKGNKLEVDREINALNLIDFINIIDNEYIRRIYPKDVINLNDYVKEIILENIPILPTSDRNIDGGTFTSVYLPNQVINGGTF